MNDIEAYQGLQDILGIINSRLDDFKDDDRLSAFINEILYGKVIEVNGHKDISGGTLSLEDDVTELVEMMQTEQEIRDLKEVCYELGDTHPDTNH